MSKYRHSEVMISQRERNLSAVTYSVAPIIATLHRKYQSHLGLLPSTLTDGSGIPSNIEIQKNQSVFVIRTFNPSNFLQAYAVIKEMSLPLNM